MITMRRMTTTTRATNRSSVAADRRTIHPLHFHILPMPTAIPTCPRTRVTTMALAACFWLLMAVMAQAGVRIGGEDYVALSAVAAQLGMRHSVGDDGKQLTLKSKWTTIEFSKDLRALKLNDITVHLGAAVIKQGDAFYISEKDYQSTLQPLLTPQVFPNPPKLKVIVLDPGHGGKDTGAQNAALKLQEKHLALDLAKRLGRLLQAKGYKVYLTRADDTFIELDERPAIANRVKADLFVSLHMNSAGTASVTGVETYVLPPAGHASTSGSGKGGEALPGNRYDPWNAMIGYYVQRELAQQLKAKDRGLKRARFAVLKTLNCPGLLVEGGFLSNTTEGRNLGWDAYRQRTAVAIADAIESYDKTLQRAAKRE